MSSSAYYVEIGDVLVKNGVRLVVCDEWGEDEDRMLVFKDAHNTKEYLSAEVAHGLILFELVDYLPEGEEEV